MKYLALIVLIILSTQKLYSQDYKDLIAEANRAAYSSDSNYVKTGKLYEIAFAASNASPRIDDYYNAACVFSLSNNQAKSLNYLEKSFKAGYDDISWSLTDSDLNSIHETLEFKLLIEKYRKPNTIYVDQFLNMLLNESDNETIYIDNKKLSLGRYPFAKNYISTYYTNATYDSGRLIINKQLVIENCTLSDAWFKDFIINGFVIQNSMIGDLVFDKAQLSSLILLDNKVVDNENKIQKILQISGASIGNIYIKNNDLDIMLSRSKFKLDHEFPLIGDGRFQSDGISRKRWNSIWHTNRIDIQGCEFDTNSNKDQVVLSLKINSKTLNISNSQFYCKVRFRGSIFEESISIRSCIFQEYVDFHDVIFPEFNVFIPFNQFDSGIARIGKEHGDPHDDWVVTTGESMAQMENNDNFLEFIYTHEFLYNQYRQRGDIESANLAYVKIKDFYLDRLNYIYDKEGGFRNLFRYRLAQLMKFYTNHGTDPSLAMLISFYIILIFAVFYFFFPSEWDTTSKARLISNFKEFRQKNSKGYIKPFFVLLGGFSMSLLNALTLSLNSFVTLGFGTIPTTGLARYVCIIQGFIGWFLLSIFTVALINQVLA